MFCCLVHSQMSGAAHFNCHFQERCHVDNIHLSQNRIKGRTFWSCGATDLLLSEWIKYTIIPWATKFFCSVRTKCFFFVHQKWSQFILSNYSTVTKILSKKFTTNKENFSSRFQYQRTILIICIYQPPVCVYMYTTDIYFIS